MRGTDNIEVIIVQRDGEIHHASYRCWKYKEDSTWFKWVIYPGILNEVTLNNPEGGCGGLGLVPSRKRGSQCGWGRVKWRLEEMTSKGNQTVLGRALKR